MMALPGRLTALAQEWTDFYRDRIGQTVTSNIGVPDFELMPRSVLRNWV